MSEDTRRDILAAIGAVLALLVAIGLAVVAIYFVATSGDVPEPPKSGEELRGP